MQRAPWFWGLGLILAGCQAPIGAAPAPVAEAPAPSAGAAAPVAEMAAATRVLKLAVRGPADLVAAGAGNIVAAGAGNAAPPDLAGVLSPNGGALVAPVAGATCRCETLAGVHLGTAVLSDARGDAAFAPGAPADGPTVAVAIFEVAGQAYRVAALVPAGAAEGPVVLDPISTMIEAVAHDAAIRRPGAPEIGAASLARIRGICERHGLSADADDLVWPATDESSAEGLRAYWEEEIEEHVTVADDREALEGFARTVAALGR